MPRLKVDGVVVEAPPGATLLEAARGAGASIPTLCAGEELPSAGSCMVCLVREQRAGRLLPSCAVTAEEGMEVLTSTPEVLRARREALDLLLAEHRGDCEGPCRRACPAHLDLPRVLRLLAAGRREEAAEEVRRGLPLAEVLGRICPAPCERACRRGGHDGPLSLRLLHRAAVEAAPAARPRDLPPGAPTVAVVGSGPAGLAAADTLLRLGRRVVVFTREERPGGALRHPAISSRLPASVLDGEIASLAARGARFETGRELGRDLGEGELRRSADEVVLATGGSGARLAVQSVARGRRLAEEADRRLGGEGLPPLRPVASSLGKLGGEELAVMLAAASPAPPVKPAAGEPGGFTPAEAGAEAARCLHCDCRKKEGCRLRERARELGARQRRFPLRAARPLRRLDHPLLAYEPAKCIRCGACIRAARAAGEEVGLALLGRGFDAVVAPPPGHTLAEALARSAEEVARLCPTGAFARKEEP